MVAKIYHNYVIDKNGYHEYGPYYCPNGIAWEDLKTICKNFRKDGFSVRVKKHPVVANAVNKNTHEVYIYTRRNC